MFDDIIKSKKKYELNDFQCDVITVLNYFRYEHKNTEILKSIIECLRTLVNALQNQGKIKDAVITKIDFCKIKIHVLIEENVDSEEIDEWQLVLFSLS